MKKPNIGAHVSASGGAFRAIENGVALGVSAIQMYGASPKMWIAKEPDKENIKKFERAREKSGISSVYLHAAYLVNLASPNNEIYEKSIKNLSDHLKITELLGANGLVFHVGSGKDLTKKEALEKEISAMKRVLKYVPGKSQLIMENSAGGGAKIGSDISDMKTLFEGVNSSRVKVCFDTAHALEAGLIEKYTEKSVKELFDKWDKEIGLKEIVALHINDSKTVFNSHHDRHENIGEGEIGIKGFRSLAEDKRLWDKDWILEVPGFEGKGPDKKNVEILKSLFK